MRNSSELDVIAFSMSLNKEIHEYFQNFYLSKNVKNFDLLERQFLGIYTYHVDKLVIRMKQEGKFGGQQMPQREKVKESDDLSIEQIKTLVCEETRKAFAFNLRAIEESAKLPCYNDIQEEMDFFLYLNSKLTFDEFLKIIKEKFKKINFVIDEFERKY